MDCELQQQQRSSFDADAPPCGGLPPPQRLGWAHEARCGPAPSKPTQLAPAGRGKAGTRLQAPQAIFLPGREMVPPRVASSISTACQSGGRSRSVTAATLWPSGPSGASSRKAWCTTMAPVCGVWLTRACGKSSAVAFDSILGRAAGGEGDLVESGAARLRQVPRKRMQG